MKPSRTIHQLVQDVLARKENEYQPSFILFLGKECADAAGVPSSLDIAHQVFTDPDLAQIYMSGRSLENDEHVWQAFAEFVGEMTVGQRYRMLQGFYASVPVPSFYQDMALLIKAGFFQRILTTSVDTLLEQALNWAGLWPDKDYAVVSLGQRDEIYPRSRSAAAGDIPIQIIKLHGDLARQEVAITKDEISRVLEPQRSFVKGELAGDLLLVGYEFESEPLNQWLAWTPGELWWVSQHKPIDGGILKIEASRQVHYLEGETARPGTFFSQLVYLLWHAPSLEESKGIDERLSQPEAGEEGYLDVEFLQSQLRRSQVMLHNLEQLSGFDQRSVMVQTQIDYQRKRVAEIEDQLRSLEGNRQRVLELLEAVCNAVSERNVEVFLRSQVKAVMSEYRRKEPNQAIISAAIGATLVLAERLSDMLDLDDGVLDQLYEFAPSILGRRGG